MLYMCIRNHCRPFIKQDRLPAHCLLIGLQTVPGARELEFFEQATDSACQIVSNSSLAGYVESNLP